MLGEILGVLLFIGFCSAPAGLIYYWNTKGSKK